MPVPSAIPESVQPPTLPLHRVRFFDHTPSPITALAFSPSALPPASDPSAKGKAKQTEATGSIPGGEAAELGVLVLARENGEIEIWEYVGPEESSMGNWVLSKILPPTLTHPGVSLMALVIRDPVAFSRKSYTVPKLDDLRLYTAGSDSGDLVERCLRTGRVLQAYAVPAPPIWTMAPSPSHSVLAIATTSPSLHFLSLTPAGIEPPPAHLLRCEPLPSRTRTVSLAWGPPRAVLDSTGDWMWQETYLVTGNSDSSFRKWEITAPDAAATGGGGSNGRVTLKGRSVVEKLKIQKKGAKGTIVWGISVLPDHTIVTSDSLGSVVFWDGASLAQRQGFKAHKADGMVLLPGFGGRVVFSAGPDQRVCQFALVEGKWQNTASKRLHNHDIRALATFPAYTPAPLGVSPRLNKENAEIAPVLASGGWDMSLIMTPCAVSDLSADRLSNPLSRYKGNSRVIFEEAWPRKMSFLGGGRTTGRVAIARAARLVLGRKDRGVGIWRILEDEQGWEKVLEMDLRMRTTTTCAAISDDGRWMAVSDLYETKLFRLVLNPTGTGEIIPKRVKNLVPALTASEATQHLALETNGTGSASMLFTPDSTRLVLGLAISGQVLVLELKDEGDGPLGVEVAKCFTRSETAVLGGSDGRVVKGTPQRKDRKLKRSAMRAIAAAAAATASKNGEMGPPEVPNGTGGHLGNGLVADVDAEDEEMEDVPPAAVATGPLGTVPDLADDARNGGQDLDSVACLAVSSDGQWLAVSDLGGKVSTYNLDTLRAHSTLPTLPNSPLALLFPPSHPSLLTILLPTQALQFYHIEQRRLLPSTPQLSTLNRALRDQYIPVQSAAFEPFAAAQPDPRSVKIVIWASDWVCTARLDLDLIARRHPDHGISAGGSGAGSGKQQKALARSLRRKRAQEAREQLERVSASSTATPTPSTPSFGALNGSASAMDGSPLSRQISVDLNHTDSDKRYRSSADDPDFYRVTHDRFRSVALADWVGQGEMILVERPLGDFVGELPAAFWTGGYGRN